MAMVIDPNLNYDYEIMCTHTQHVLMPKIWPENMMETIEAIVKLLSRCPKSPLFKFEMNGEAAESNFHVLRKFNFDLEKALVAQVGSPVVYRSEFSKGELLLPLLQVITLLLLLLQVITLLHPPLALCTAPVATSASTLHAAHTILAYKEA